MGMIEISDKHRGGGIGRAIKDFKESLECLKEDFYTVMEELESMGERGEGGGQSYGYRDEEDRYDREYEERMGERRGRRRRR